MTDADPNRTDADSIWTRRDLLQKGALAGGGLVFGGIALTGRGTADPAETTTFHDDSVLPSGGTCIGEDMQLSATARVVTQGDPEEGHFHLNGTVHGDAVGLETGTVYRFNESFVDVHPQGRGTFTSRLIALHVSRGPADNLVVEYLFHVTVNADGKPTAMKIEPISFECRG